MTGRAYWTFSCRNSSVDAPTLSNSLPYLNNVISVAALLDGVMALSPEEVLEAFGQRSPGSKLGR